MKTVNISANISEDLAKKLEEVAEFEGRSKSFYIKKGLVEVLGEKFQDMQDLISAQKTLKTAKAKGEELISFDKVFKGIR